MRRAKQTKSLCFSKALTLLSGLGAQPNGSSLDTTLFHFGGVPLQLFNDTMFKGNTGCSPNSPSDYMTIETMVRCGLMGLFAPRPVCSCVRANLEHCLHLVLDACGQQL